MGRGASWGGKRINLGELGESHDIWSGRRGRGRVGSSMACLLSPSPTLGTQAH